MRSTTELERNRSVKRERTERNPERSGEEAVIDAEVRIGELMREIPKAQGTRTDLELSLPAKTKLETLKDNGFTKDIGNQFEQMSRHPEAVAEARRNSEPKHERSSIIGSFGTLKKGVMKVL